MKWIIIDIVDSFEKEIENLEKYFSKLTNANLNSKYYSNQYDSYNLQNFGPIITFNKPLTTLQSVHKKKEREKFKDLQKEEKTIITNVKLLKDLKVNEEAILAKKKSE